MESISGLSCIRLVLAGETLDHYGRALGLPDLRAALVALARAISVSEGWRAAARDAVIVVRLRPTPQLAVLGSFDEAGEAWLTGQARVLNAACRSVRRLDYRQIEEDVERLAARLLDRFGRAEMGRARVVAIPRGGFIVLGLLATALGLEHGQLAPPDSCRQPLIIVDDCALSGMRFRDVLGQYEGYEQVVFAHLYSRPELRAAIERDEPRVVACLSAADLRLQQDTGAGSRRMDSGVGGSPYWLGKTEALCLPWNEPDRLMWNAYHRRSEAAWRIVPPELCFKNRTGPGIRPIPVQVLPDGKGPITLGSDVIAGDLGGRTVLYRLESGESAALDPVAASMWQAILQHGELEQAVTELDQEFAVAQGDLRRDLTELTEELIARGFLEDQVS